jgi:hypothetical protein
MLAGRSFILRHCYSFWPLICGRVLSSGVGGFIGEEFHGTRG